MNFQPLIIILSITIFATLLVCLIFLIKGIPLTFETLKVPLTQSFFGAIYGGGIALLINAIYVKIYGDLALSGIFFKLFQIYFCMGSYFIFWNCLIYPFIFSREFELDLMAKRIRDFIFSIFNKRD
jgi:hypothetical protein